MNRYDSEPTRFESYAGHISWPWSLRMHSMSIQATKLWIPGFRSRHMSLFQACYMYVFQTSTSSSTPIWPVYRCSCCIVIGCMSKTAGIFLVTCSSRFCPSTNSLTVLHICLMLLCVNVSLKACQCHSHCRQLWTVWKGISWNNQHVVEFYIN